LTLGGNSQAVLIRGKNINNPVMLYLHMGPGLSETGMMRNHHAWLEEYFTMVYLDQRGGGKSYSVFNNPKDFTTDQLVEDVHELTLYLKKRFHKENIAVMGHSFGAPFGLLAAHKYPEDYSIYIGIGQPVDPVECDRLSYAHLIDVATKEGNAKAVKELEKINGYWNTQDTKEFNRGMMVLKKWVGFYGGQIYGAHGPTSFILKNSMCHEFTFFDWLPYFAGMFYSISVSGDIMITTDLRTMAPELKMPVIIMEGRHDINTYPTLVEEYYTMLKAPTKKLFWFEQSAHFPHFEEKDVFQKIMLESVRPLITGKTTP
jgi:pimeloyl-ACP methyl ester carboxylesterase